MLLPVPVDFLVQLPLVSLCLNRHDLFYVLFLVGVGSDMRSVNEDGAGIHKAAPNRLLQNVTEDSFKQICSIKPTLVILPKRQKMRDILGSATKGDILILETVGALFSHSGIIRQSPAAGPHRRALPTPPAQIRSAGSAAVSVRETDNPK